MYFKTLYLVYLFLRDTILKPTSYLGPAITVLSILSFYKITGDVALTSVYSVIFYTLLWFLGKGLWLIIQKVIRNTGTNARFIFPGKYLIRNPDGDPCTLNVEDINSARFEFATEATAALSAEFNMRAYRNSLWETSFEEKFNRNISHIRKNRLSIMFVKSLIDNKYLGYTHILPVSKRTWDKYLDGKIGDNTFSEKLIASDSPNEKEHKQPYGLILFSVASVTYDSELKNESKNLVKNIGDLYEQAVVYHLKSYLNTQFKSQNLVEVLLQNMSEDYMNFFKDFAKSTNRLSADGAYIIVFDISNA